MRIVVHGLMGTYPFGGVIWDYIQYVLGFRALGHDVYYLEDSGIWPYDPVQETITEDCSFNVGALDRIMGAFDLGDRWIYRNAADGKFHGAGEKLARELIREGDLLVQVSTLSMLSDYECGVRHKMFIDGDPMFNQIQISTKSEHPYNVWLKAHDSHFSFGLKLGQADCLAPDCGIRWRPTLQPVSLDHWQYEEGGHNGAFTTVMNWVSYEPQEWNGAVWGQKDIEFLKFIDLQQRSGAKFEVAMGKGKGRSRPTDEIIEKGWEIKEPEKVIPDESSYRSYLASSMAEWSIAKHGYVAGRTGWFSCRTACYLALGRPALVQDTGWSECLEHGDGLVPFRTMEDCLKGIESIQGGYDRHRLAARRFAEQYLDARIVCAKLLEDAGLD